MNRWRGLLPLFLTICRGILPLKIIMELFAADTSYDIMEQVQEGKVNFVIKLRLHLSDLFSAKSGWHLSAYK